MSEGCPGQVDRPGRSERAYGILLPGWSRLLMVSSAHATGRPDASTLMMASRDAPESERSASAAPSDPAATPSSADPAKNEPGSPEAKPSAGAGTGSAKAASRKRAGQPSVPSSSPAPDLPGSQGSASGEARGRRRTRPYVLFLGVGLAVALAVAAGLAVWEFRRDVAAAHGEAQALEARIAELEQQVSANASRALTESDLQHLAAQVERVAADQDALAFRTEVDALGASLGRQLRAVEDRLGALVLVPGSEADAVAVTGRFAEISRAVSADLERVQVGLRALATARVIRRVGAETVRGRPFADSLELLRELVGGDTEATAALTELAPHALSGVTTAAELARQFSIAEPAARAALRDPAAGGLDRLLERVTGLVEVRRTQIPEGDSAEAVLARVSFLVDAGDLRAAWEESGTLPEVAQAELADWRDEVGRVLAAAAAVQVLEYYADRRIAKLVQKTDLPPVPERR